MFDAAIKALIDLLSAVDTQEWVSPTTKRFVMSGIRMSIKHLVRLQATNQMERS